MSTRSRVPPLRVGMIGAGFVGQKAHLANLQADARCRVVALAELRPGLAERVAAAYGIPRVYTTHIELLGNPEIQAVVVVTRPAATGPIVRDALSAGRHVFSEKPMAHTLEQGRLLVQAASERQLCYAVGFMKRHDPGVLCARDFLVECRASGTLGSLQLIRGYSLHGEVELPQGDFQMTEEPRPSGLKLWATAPDWIPESMRDNYAAFLNVHSHLLNLLRFLWDDTIAVRSTDLERMRSRFVTLDIGVVPAILELRDHSTGPWTEGVEFFFESGSVHVTLPPPFARDRVATVTVRRRTASQELEPGERGWAFARQSSSWVDDVLSDREPVTNGADSLQDLELTESIWRRQCGLVDVKGGVRP